MERAKLALNEVDAPCLARVPGIGLLWCSNDFFLLEALRRLVEAPCRDLSWFVIHDAKDEVRVPGGRAGSVEFRWHRGVVRMAVIDADQVQASRPSLVVRVEQFMRIDHVPAGPRVRRDALAGGEFLFSVVFTRGGTRRT